MLIKLFSGMGLWKRGHRAPPGTYDGNGTKVDNGEFVARRCRFINQSSPDLTRTEIHLVFIHYLFHINNIYIYIYVYIYICIDIYIQYIRIYKYIYFLNLQIRIFKWAGTDR